MMTPKEKAMEIAMKFDEKGETDNAIQCALICVDEILKNQPYDIYTIDQCNNLTKYWKEVKKELKRIL